VTFAEIGARIGTSPQGAQYIFQSAIQKLRRNPVLRGYMGLDAVTLPTPKRGVPVGYKFGPRPKKNLEPWPDCQYCHRRATSRRKQLCDNHARRLRLYGDPLAPRKNAARPKAVRDRAKKACSFEGCNRRSRAKGMCDTHYRQMKHKGMATPIIFNSDRKCCIGGCNSYVQSRGMCSKHRRQARSAEATQ
jgi:hypothetical protein